MNGPGCISARRVLTLALCYVLALQAFLAAYGTAFAVSRGESGFVICHGDGSTPARDTANADKAPCALCAVASAASGLLPEAPVSFVTPAIVAGRVVYADTTVTFPSPPRRAGLSRAPPSFA